LGQGRSIDMGAKVANKGTKRKRVRTKSEKNCKRAQKKTTRWSGLKGKTRHKNKEQRAQQKKKKKKLGQESGLPHERGAQNTGTLREEGSLEKKTVGREGNQRGWTPRELQNTMRQLARGDFWKQGGSVWGGGAGGGTKSVKGRPQDAKKIPRKQGTSGKSPRRHKKKLRREG